MIRKLVSTCFYVGCVPGAPGTYGSFAALAVALVLLQFAPPATTGLVLLGLAALLTFVGAPLGTWAEGYYGKKDPSPFVLDEVVGCFVAMAPVLLLFPNARPLLGLGGAFVFFRIFDVLKPFPIYLAEKAPAGWGIMLDDLVAGCYAAGATIAGMLLFADMLVKS
ncbi:MAG: phosphatidylglycerophosphatase A [Planctomycetes bacterium]|nr:phosphatidylglycerophosphatase A [Planctomycetota bacterium]